MRARVAGGERAQEPMPGVVRRRSVRDARPISHQEKDGRRVEVPTTFHLEAPDPAGDLVYGFALGEYDPSLR